MATDFWDSLATQRLAELKPNVLTSYRKLYQEKAVALALEKCSGRQVLKVDLWTEVVEHQRDMLRFLGMFDLDVYAVELSHVLCIKTRLNHDAATVQGDIRHLPFADKSLDAILDLSTIDHLPENEGPNIIMEYYRCLRKNGVLLLIATYRSWLVRLRKCEQKRKVSQLLL